MDRKYLLPALLSVAYILSLSGCLEGSSGEPSPVVDGGTIVDVEDPPSFDPGTTICDPFGASRSFPDRGLVGRLFYKEWLPNEIKYTSVNDYVEQGTAVDANLYFNRLDSPTRPFDRGFTTEDGLTLVNQQGEVLYEYFALEMFTKIKLAPGDEPGDYQFALLADDGAILSFKDAPGDIIVNDDGVHPTRMGCGAGSYYMDENTRLNVRLRYYQGPRYHISLMVLMRRVPTDPALVTDVSCNTQGNTRFFDSTQNPPAPKLNYYEILERGWKLLENRNYELPTVGLNPCAPQEEPIELFDVLVSSITNATAVVSWSTNLTSSSAVELTNTATGVVTMLPVNSTMVTSHSYSVSGLTAFTLYSVRPVSKSAGGQEIFGDPKVFRTAR